MAAWHQWELAVYGILSVVPPLAVYFLEERRRRRWRRCLAVTRGRASANADQLWRSLHTRVHEGHRLELACCAEHSLGWIDIFGAEPLSASPGRHPQRADPPPPQPRLVDVPHGPKPRQADGMPRAAEGDAHEVPAFNGGLSNDADAAPSADRARPAAAAAAVLEDSSDSSPPADGWALEGRVQRPWGLGLAEDGWAGAEVEAGAWHGLSGEEGVRLGGEPRAGEAREERGRELAERGVENGAEHGGEHGEGAAAGAAGAAEAGGDVMRPQPRTLFDAAGVVFGRSGAASGGATSPPPTQLLEQRVAYQLCLCGSGTLLSPYHLEMSDFLVYAGMSAALGEAGHLCAARLNPQTDPDPNPNPHPTPHPRPNPQPQPQP